MVKTLLNEDQFVWYLCQICSAVSFKIISVSFLTTGTKTRQETCHGVHVRAPFDVSRYVLCVILAAALILACLHIVIYHAILLS